MKAKSYRIRFRKQDLLALPVWNRAQTGAYLPQGKLIASALAKWADLDENMKLSYLSKVYHTTGVDDGRNTQMVRVSYETYLDVLVLADWRKTLHGDVTRQATPAVAFAAVVDYVTSGANVTPMPETQVRERITRPRRADTQTQLLTAILDELRVIRVTLAAQGLGCEPTAISQEWLDNSYAAAYAKVTGAIQ